MHAQTTTTPAQANEATPIGANKAKRGALSTIRPGETPVQAAICAAETQRWDVMEAASKAHTAAELAESAARAALEAVPFPADLIVQAKPKITDDPLTWVTAIVSRHPVDGREIRKEIDRDRTERLDSPDAIIAHFGADHPDLQKHIAAFESWEAETAPLRLAAERAKKAEDKADHAFRRSYTINDRLCRAILQAPAEPGEALQQVEAYTRLLSSCNGRNTKPEEITFAEDQAPLVKFMYAALKRVDATPPPAGKFEHQAAQALAVAA